MLLTGAVTAQTIAVAGKTEISEGDNGEEAGAFRYQFTATQPNDSVELAVIPRNLQAGADFTPLRKTLISTGGVLEGTITVPVLPDLEEEGAGSLSLVARGPGFPDWASSMTDPENFSEFSDAAVGGSVLFWGDGKVVSARMKADGNGSEILTWERTAAGTVVPRSSIQFAGTAAFDAAVSSRAVVLISGGSLRTWSPAPENPFAWQESVSFLNSLQRQPRLFSDRLVVAQGDLNIVFRQDETAEVGWRRTGIMGFGAIVGVEEDFAVIQRDKIVSVWERGVGSEDLWSATYQASSTFTDGICATAPGMMALAGPSGLEIHERGSGGWAKVATLALIPPPAGDTVMSVAMAGDWLAVGMGSKTNSGPDGTVRLFLRSAADRTQWEPAGTLTGPGAGYGRRLIWNGRDLVSMGAGAGETPGGVVIRRFTGATVTVTDDDAAKLYVTSFVLREPFSGTGTAEVLAELPLPAAAEVRIDYAVLAGTAAAGVNFVPTAGQVTIPAGSTRVSIPVTLLADNKLEPAKTIRIRLTTSGQPSVIQEVAIQESGSPAVVTAEAPQLVEGCGSSTLTIREEPSTGGRSPTAPVELNIFTGGFAGSNYASTLATGNVDIANSRTTRILKESAPVARLTLEAIDDAIREDRYAAADEQVKAVHDGLGPEREAGSFGLALDAALPKPPVTDPPGGFTPSDWTISGDWFIVCWSGSSLSRQDVMAFHRWDRENGIQPLPVQVLNVEKGEGSGYSLSAGGGLVSLSYFRWEAGQRRCVMALYGQDGPQEALWKKTSQWSVPVGSQSEMRPLMEFLGQDGLRWRDLLLQKYTGRWAWRLAANDLGGGKGKASQNHRLMFGRDSAGQGVAFIDRQMRPGQPEWTRLRSFQIQGGAVEETVADAMIHGRTLAILGTYGNLEMWWESAPDVWIWEQTLPNSGELIRVGDSTVITSKWIFRRTGPAEYPWIAGQALGAVPDFAGENCFGTTTTDSSLQSWGARIWTPGAPLSIYDDESLTFELMADSMMTESSFGESVGSFGVKISRPPPFPLTLHIRSRDTGDAQPGVDYVPFDYYHTVPPNVFAFGGDYVSFPVRILSDRLPEAFESFEAVLDPPIFGYGGGSLKLPISDPWYYSLKPGLPATTLVEPIEGTSVQAVEFVLEAALSKDVEFTVTAGGGTAREGEDYAALPTRVTLKAGGNRLRVPVTVMADEVREGTEKLVITVSADWHPTLVHASAQVEIGDASFPGLKAESFAGTQQTPLKAGPADGLAVNDPITPQGAYALAAPPSWGTASVQPDGSFTVIPGPNVIGPVFFMARAETILYRQFLDSSAVWKYLHPTNGRDPGQSNPAFALGWMKPGFDDSGWSSASGTLAYGDFPIAVKDNLVVLPAPASGNRYTDYFRTTFQSDQAFSSVPLKLQLYCDDGAIIYINGIERGRAQSGKSLSFLTAPDAYRLLTGYFHSEAEEVVPQTVVMKDVPLNTGTNTLAVSLHNNSNDSTDLGLRLMSLDMQETSDPIPVALQFADAGKSPEGKPDTFVCPQNASFTTSDHFGNGLLENDGLIAPSGLAYDPILEITVSAVSTGTLTLAGNTGHFTYQPPPEFSGTAMFAYYVRDKDGISPPIPVTLNVQPIQPFDVWKAAARLPAVGGTEDSDGDGASNLLEYALGSDPADGSVGNGFGFERAEGGGLKVFVRRASDLAWKLESTASPESPEWRVEVESRGLSFFTPLPPGITYPNWNSTLIINPDVKAAPRRFYRLSTQRIPPQ